MKSFAAIVSRVLEPISVLLIVLVILLFRLQLSLSSMLLTIAVFIFVMIAPSVFVVLVALKKKTLSNWDMSVREERIRLVPIIFFFLFLGTVMLWLLGVSQVMQFCMFMLLAFAGFVIITFWFKISGHMIVATACMTCLSVWYPGYAAFFIGLLPLLGWSRVVLKRHTVMQVVTGFMYGALVGCVGILFHLL